MAAGKNSAFFPEGLAFGKRAARIALIGLAYFLAHEISFFFPDAEKILMAVWPAGGIGLAALLLSPRSAWPVILAALFVAGNAANLFSGRPFFNSVGFMTANICESLACAGIMRAWCGDTIRFTRIRDIAALTFAATVANAGTACIGAATAALAGTANFANFWAAWWVSDGLGLLLVTPFVVSWVSPTRSLEPMGWRKRLEWLVFLAAWLFVALEAFKAHHHTFSPQPYMLLLLVSWPALRFGQRTVSLSFVILAAFSVASDVVVDGPLLWGGQTPVERLLSLQMFLAFCAVAGFILTTSRAETRLAERVSRENHDRLRALSDNLPNGMVYQIVRELDGKMRFTYVSAGCQALNGVPAEDAMADSATLYGLLVEEDRERFRAAEEASMENTALFQIDVRFRRPDGELRWMHVASSPRRLQDGRLIWDGIQVDITERKRTEDLLRDAQRLESIGILAGGIAHDFNNLLGIIVGNLSLAQLGQESGTPEHSALEQASVACKRASELSYRLLTLSKGGSPIRAATRLGPLIADTVKLATSGSKVALEFDLPDDPPTAEVDDGQLRQVFSNLAINARDAMPNGGKLQISASVQALAEGAVASLAPGKYHKIVVRDEGTGIPADILHRVFDPYFTTKEKGTQKGQGLGLTICHSIITKHGGDISVASVAGSGTTFTLYLPTSTAPADLMPTESSLDKISMRGAPRRILVLDDEPDMRTMIGHLLHRFGHESVTAADSTSALDAYRRALSDGRPFDLVILDLTVQGGAGGLETFQELRKIDPQAKAVVTSGYADDPAIQNYSSYGFCAALTKPYSLSALKNALRIAA
jgi:PAS domain S-box-containing protein